MKENNSITIIIYQYKVTHMDDREGYTAYCTYILEKQD